MREKIIAMVVLFLLLLPAVAQNTQNTKLEYNYPFYCSKDMAVVFYWSEAYTDESYLFSYDGSPIEITVIEGGKVTYEKVRLTTPDQYYEIHPKKGRLVMFIIRSTGESTFDIDSGVNIPAMRRDWGHVYSFGNDICLSENALENYEIKILLPMHKEKFQFYTGLEKGKIWIEDDKNETRYGPLKNVSYLKNQYEINTTELDKNKTWYITFTDLKGVKKFYVSGIYTTSFNNTITVLRPRNFFTTKEDVGYVPGGPKLPW